MKILRSSRIRAIGRSLQNQTSTLDTQVVSVIPGFGACGGSDKEFTAPPTTPLPFLFFCAGVDYPRPDCNNKDTSSGTSEKCKNALRKLDNLPSNLKNFLEKNKLM